MPATDAINILWNQVCINQLINSTTFQSTYAVDTIDGHGLSNKPCCEHLAKERKGGTVL